VDARSYRVRFAQNAKLHHHSHFREAAESGPAQSKALLRILTDFVEKLLIE
jgi:hypothetical protein